MSDTPRVSQEGGRKRDSKDKKHDYEKAKASNTDQRGTHDKVSLQESLQKHQRAQATPEQVQVWNISDLSAAHRLSVW